MKLVLIDSLAIPARSKIDVSAPFGERGEIVVAHMVVRRLWPQRLWHWRTRYHHLRAVWLLPGDPQPPDRKTWTEKELFAVQKARLERSRRSLERHVVVAYSLVLAIYVLFAVFAIIDRSLAPSFITSAVILLAVLLIGKTANEHYLQKRLFARRDAEDARFDQLLDDGRRALRKVDDEMARWASGYRPRPEKKPAERFDPKDLLKP